MNKRILAVLLVLCMAVSLLPTDVLADESAATVMNSGTCGDHLSWELDEVGTLTISGSGAMRDYSSSYDVPWYVYNNPITTVALPDGITSIGASAFSGCNGLTSISIPDTVTSIGKYAFECSSLTSVSIPDGVNSIGNGAFYDCSSLASVDIPASLTGIGNEAFYNCTALSSVTIPSGVTSIGDGAFWNCNSRIIAPMSACTLRAISGEGSFVGCNVLVTAGHSFDSGTDDKNGTITYACTECDCSYELSYAIDQDKNEAAVTGITCDADNTFAIRVVIPAEINGAKVVSIDNVVGLSSITEVVIPDGVTSIGDHAFSGCSGLTNVIIPEGVTSIGSCAFENCTSLTSLTLSASVTNIGVNSFGMKYSNVDQKYYPVRDLTAYVYPGTAAENYCKSNGVNYELVFHYSDDWSIDAEKHWHACTDDGYTDLKQDEAEHIWNDGEVTQEATHLAEGILTYTCLTCGGTKTEAIPMVKTEGIITKQPESVDANNGDEVLFSINAENAVSYQWQYSKDSGKNWNNSPAAGNTTHTVSVSVATYKNGYLYRCMITDSNGKTITSDAAKLTVLPAITRQPADASAQAGDTAKFTITATGTSLKYQWQYSKDNGKNWYNSTAAGNTSATVSIAVAAHKNGYLYRCVITDSNGKKVISDDVKLTVLLTITKQPADVSAKSGDTVKFTVTASGSALKYQWQYSKDGGKTWYNSPAAGNTTNTVSIAVATHKNSYLYRCVITDSNGKTITSDDAKLMVAATEPTITKQPVGATAIAGDSAKFTVTASGSGLKYQWQYSKDGGNNWCNSPAAGNTTSAVSIAAATHKNGYLYRCVITDRNGRTVTSDAAILTVKAT